MAEATNFDVQAILVKIGSKCSQKQGKFECKMWEGATSKNGTYGILRNPLQKLPEQPQTISVHRLVYLLYNVKDYPSYILPHFDDAGKTLHVSHLCHNTLCVNIDHLRLELQSINNERESCYKQGHCIGLHRPPCLL